MAVRLHLDVEGNRVTYRTMRLRVAGMCGGLGAAIGVILFGTTTARLLLFSTAGFLIGSALGFVLASQVKKKETAVHAERVLKVDVVVRIVICWGLVALGIAALILRGWNVVAALITIGFLIAALLVTFHKRTREGHDLERSRNSRS